MLYESTRGGQKGLTSAEAIKQGIAGDGGLFVPDSRVRFSLEQIAAMAGMSYQDRAATVLAPYLTDFTAGEIRECVANAYRAPKFDTPAIAPLVRTAGGDHYLELWHGPTLAFKDMALQILPHLLQRSMTKTGEPFDIVILVATSGDTGKAALEGFRDVPKTRIIVFFPNQGVSEVQKLQMITQEGGNVGVFAVRGNFDDAQTGVKAIFTDPETVKKLAEHNFKFSSANSINWGRLVPQIAYYFSAYADLLKNGVIAPGEQINFVVPTGNFGNILAGFYARRMGLPVRRLICAANTNNVLTDFIRTGTYDKNRRFEKTISPSMDILVSSNLERLLYELTGHDAEKVSGWMSDLRDKGRYDVDRSTRYRITELFWSDWASDDETLKTIRKVHEDTGYVLDTHTAVGKAVYERYKEETGDGTWTVIVSTASPFKFNASVARAILGEDTVAGKSEFELLSMLAEATGLSVPPALRDLDKKPVLHPRVVEPEEMRDAVLAMLIGRN
ncbi:threonine synthase [Desulforudis sp. 1088]|uniref:threonine synthase n=2 Tax=Candidatus Desulforudis TaxID=471826 RepID=UPI003CE52838